MNSKLQKRWIAGERWVELKQVLDLPVMQEALAIIEDEAKPNAEVNVEMTKVLNAADGAFRLATVFNQKAGIQRAVERLRALAEVPTERKPLEAPEPLGHINENNFEDYLK